ncbi:MAG: DUF3466 family protein, partial [Tolumonas sp.]
TYCSSVLSSTTCDAYADNSNTASQWFSDLSANTAQTYNIVATGVASGSITKAVSSESEGIITRYSHDDSEIDSVGYVLLSDHKRKAVATIAGSSVDVTDGADYAFASAYDIIPVGSDYLVIGTAGNKKSTAYNYCYNGSDIDSYSAYCPGYTTQAGFWLVNASSGVANKQLATSYYTAEDSDYPYTAGALGITKVGDEYIAVGYSATWGNTLNSTTRRPKNLATFWNLGDGSLTAAPATGRIFSNNSDNPGTDSDYYYDNGWAVGINENGYIIGNRSYRLKESRNYPTKMFVAKYNSGSVSIVSSEIISSEGIDSEGAAINNNNQVVGWTDERSTTTDTVIGSVPRLQEAFLYNITTGNRYALNDLICGSASSCSQNGYYYYIEYANDILDDGTILASARRFSSYDNWSTLSNGTNVVVKLKVSSSTAFASNGDVPSSYVVSNQLPIFDYGASSGSSGGGSFGVFGLLAMAGAALVGQYRRFVKKPS